MSHVDHDEVQRRALDPNSDWPEPALKMGSPKLEEKLGDWIPKTSPKSHAKLKDSPQTASVSGGSAETTTAVDPDIGLGPAIRMGLVADPQSDSTA